MLLKQRTIGDGRKVVAVVGTAEALASATEARVVIITAETNNTGTVTVGSSTVVDATATRRGTPLLAGESMTLYIKNLSQVYLDVSVAGDSVTYIYTND